MPFDQSPEIAEIDEMNAEERPRGGRLSDILRTLADDDTQARISLADLVDALRHRAHGALLFIFAVPNVLPTPPGTSAILGAPLIFLAFQLALSRKPWLPKIIANRSMARSDFSRIVERVLPWLARAERLLKPRLTPIVYPPGQNIIGAVCFLLSIILFLPIPLGNIFPALAICILALGLLERDGVWVLAGWLAAASSTVVVSGVVYALAKSALFVISGAFG
ncbi:Exopolysaccharide synthesis, ExoD [Hartmannibacter diazotrophicus]|uniref:Exopolysaccharide synthesis, ExoD n=1 Tax=Hartmannibacter diazotrophicus TaxID=1482074 RepID=A0A2C9DAN1_9HYPH|nr:exopolysaccharide biosynthesis protein [Hartmannibacter diazotrophicus]SON57188.1 Exopolysaccharide synthesis, ExoD [Hartmannibacter diazotrophicus]